MPGTLDDSLRAAVAAAVAPLAVEVRALRDSLDALRAAQPAQMLSVTQAAQRLGISACSVRRHIADGTLPSRRVGRRVVISADALRPMDAAEVARLAREAQG